MPASKKQLICQTNELLEKKRVLQSILVNLGISQKFLMNNF